MCERSATVGALLLLGLVALASAELKWWQNTLVYQVYPRSFRDSDGDGVGDLKGIEQGLDHLKDIGVTAVWISPIYPSPQVDFGYDISDFLGIDPQYGTMEDFESLAKRCKELGIKLVMDFVPNHSSDKHEWFKKSVERIDPYTNYYMWHDGKTLPNGTHTPPNNWLSVFRGSGWTWNKQRQQYYYHQFAVEQPDFDLRNENVMKEIEEILRFWGKKGVDGFRIDAAPFLYEDVGLLDEPRGKWSDDPEEHPYLDHIYTLNQPESYTFFQRLRKVVDTEFPEAVMMAEAYGSLNETVGYYGTPSSPGAHFSFNFFLVMDLNKRSRAGLFKNIIDMWMSKMDDFYTPNWVLGNHDQTRVANRFGPEMVDTMNMLSLTLPGISVTYYGEEIGMQDTHVRWDETLDPQALNKGEGNYESGSRDFFRSPFQWNSQVSAGFSTNTKTWLPVNPNYWWLNLDAQKAAKKSHYHVYKAMTRARKELTVKEGSLKTETCCTGNATTDDVLVITRSLKDNPTFVLFINTGSVPVKVSTQKYVSGAAKVWIPSMNVALNPGSALAAELTLPQKGSVLITTGNVPAEITPTSPGKNVSAVPTASTSAIFLSLLVAMATALIR